MKVLFLHNKDVLRQACSALIQGKVIAFPTDTVYGFIALATNKKAVQSIFQIKKRSRQKPFPLFVSGIHMAKQIAIIGKLQEKFLKSHWPGSYTMILPRNQRFLTSLYGIDKQTIALRVPASKPLRFLLRALSMPLVQTSVNIAGMPPIQSAQEIVRQFKNRKYKPFLVIDGGILKGKSSQVLDGIAYPFRIVRS